jgi:ABC-type dipeptide/oligopeptide/nickel transport system permease subunit
MNVSTMAMRSLDAFARMSIGRAFASGIGMVAGGFLILIVLVAVFAPWIAPFDFAAQNLMDANARRVGRICSVQTSSGAMCCPA